MTAIVRKIACRAGMMAELTFYGSLLLIINLAFLAIFRRWPPEDADDRLEAWN